MRSRLIDLEAERVLWQGLCEYGKEAEPAPRRLFDFTANGGSFLRQTLTDAAALCAEVLLDQFREHGG